MLRRSPLAAKNGFVFFLFPLHFPAGSVAAVRSFHGRAAMILGRRQGLVAAGTGARAHVVISREGGLYAPPPTHLPLKMIVELRLLAAVAGGAVWPTPVGGVVSTRHWRVPGTALAGWKGERSLPRARGP